MRHNNTRQPFATIISIFGASILPLALVAGLLSFPTVCACGGELPHEHALFTLDHHSHARAIKRGIASDDPSQHPIAGEVDSTESSVQVPSFSLNGKAQAATFVATPLDASEASAVGVATTTEYHDGLVTRPVTPPPQA